MKQKGQAYLSAGVDNGAAGRVIEKIKNYTAITKRPGFVKNIGDFAGFFDLNKSGEYFEPLLVASTDGVGTKLKLAIECDSHYGIGIDLVAMCVNDIITHGAEPLFFMDYFAAGKIDEQVIEDIIAGISAGCIKANAALIGGEIANMPGHYKNHDYDVAGFALGIVEKRDILPKGHLKESLEENIDEKNKTQNIKQDDVVLAIESSGFHANGYSLVRKIIKDNKIKLQKSAKWDKNKSLAEILLEPTKIYVKAILAIRKDKALRAIANITGGGVYENIPRILPDNLKVVLKPKNMPENPLFHYIKDIGKLDSEDMWNTFNCGIGMILITAPEAEDEIKRKITENNEKIYRIGIVQKRKNNERQVEILDDIF